MRTSRTGLLRAGVSGLVLLLGCDQHARLNENPAEKPDYPEVSLVELMNNRSKYAGKKLTIKGIPVSVHSVGYGDEGHGATSLVIKDNEGNILLCYRHSKSLPVHVQAKSLIDTEINDNDNEEITVRGTLSESGTLAIDSLRALNYDLEFLNWND